MGTINKVFLYNGDPQNGANAQLWQITAFAAYTDSTATVQDNPLEAWMVECLTSNGAVFAVGDVIRMGTEYCLIWAKSGNTIYIIRAWHGSTSAQQVQNTVIYDEAITPPVEDDVVPGAGQQGGDITTGVAYGGDGAYRFDAVPEMEYYASVTYDGHITYVHCFVERNDITPEQIMTVRGDTLYRDATTVTRKAIGAANQVPLSDGTDWDWATSSVTATREFFAPAHCGSVEAQLSQQGDFGGVTSLTGAGQFIYCTFYVPHDFNAITEAVFTLIPFAANGAADIDIDSDFGAAGEAYNNTSLNDAAATYPLVQWQIYEIDISGILVGLAADDYVGVKITDNSGNGNLFLGVRFKYT